MAWHVLGVQIIFLRYKNALASNNIGVVVVNSKVVGLALGDRELHRQFCKIYSATSSLVRFENKSIYFYFGKTLWPTTTLAMYIVVNSGVVGLALGIFRF
jgi:hypothetical protein